MSNRAGWMWRGERERGGWSRGCRARCVWRKRVGTHVARQASRKCFCGAMVIRRIMRLQRICSIGMRCCSPARWRNAGAEEEEEEEDEDRQSCAEFLGGGLGRRRRVALRPKGKKDGEHECECKSVCSWAKAMAQQHPPLAQREGRRDAAAAVAYRARAPLPRTRKKQESSCPYALKYSHAT